MGDEALMPKVSIIVPCYDGETYLGRALESVQRQTLTDWELVVVDDGSPGPFEQAVEPFLSDPRIRVIRQANGGQSRARNAGYRALHGPSEYVHFLDGDDVLEPEMLATITSYLDAHPEAGMGFCDRMLIDGDDQPIPDYHDDQIRRYAPNGRRVRLLAPDSPDTPFISFFAYNIAVPSVTVLRRTVFDEVGGWDEGLRPFCEDTDMWLRVSLRTCAHYLPHRLVRRRLHGRQITRSDAADSGFRIGRALLEQKWRDATGLTPAELQLVTEARHFRDARLLPHLWLGWARERWRRGQPVEAAKCVLRAGRQLAFHGVRGSP